MKPLQDLPIRDRIAAALAEAEDAEDRTRLCTLRLVACALRDRDAALRAREDGPDRISDADAAEMLSTMIRQREASASAYEESGRLDLAEEERNEIEVLREFLPRPLSEEEVSRAVSETIDRTGARSLADLGAVMGALKSRYAGRMDFCTAGAAVRARLG